jgi:arginyl-tRNA synthetase
MTDIQSSIKKSIQIAFKNNFQHDVSWENLKLESTNKDFSGEYTFVVFPFLKFTRKRPEESAEIIGTYVKSEVEEIASFNVVKGFLNFELKDSYWINFTARERNNTSYGKNESGKLQKVMVEYSSPNTNKPLHLGHIRNNLLGFALSEVLAFSGYDVVRSNLVNDRGIHICKSMLAWQMFGNGETPESSGVKGDHLVGKYYVKFDQAYKSEILELQAGGLSEDEAKTTSKLMADAQLMLKNWEENDAQTIELWKKMNAWVYKGFEETYKRLGVNFDKIYYESNTYLIGKEEVNNALGKGSVYKKDDGSVWADLSSEDLDDKLLLRKDGTSVYITQDIGTAKIKFEDFNLDKSIYVVGNEQDYHFKILKVILGKMNYDFAKNIEHMSYGMVDLPSGKMKSREGTVVDADDLMAEMYATARNRTEEQGKTEGMSSEELGKLYETLGMAALKYFLLKVEPSRKMLFNPEESIDFQGNTATFIQYAYARSQSILRNLDSLDLRISEVSLHDTEKELIRHIHSFPQKAEDAASQKNPAAIAQFIYDTAKLYNQMYNSVYILKEEDEAKRNLRLAICQLSGNNIRSGAALLGIQMPERM